MDRQKGSTLTDLIITIVFIGIAFPGMFAFFANTSSQAVNLDLQTQAVVLAQDKLESISGDRYDPTRGLNWVISPSRYQDESFDQFVRRVSITPQVINTIDGFQVSVEITHPKIQTYTLSVFFTRY